VIVIELCPMYVASALAFTPAAIISEAAVCRASCNPIGVSFAVRLAENHSEIVKPGRGRSVPLATDEAAESDESD
jgi:hypothetical protein